MSHTFDQKDKIEKRDHSVFEADIEGQAMNLQYLKRIASWVRPHKKLAALSIILVVVASGLAVLMPVLLSRVVVDGILTVSYTHLTLPTILLV